MLKKRERFHVAAEDIIHEIIDREVIIVNTLIGHYFSLNETGASIWESLVEGHSLEEITKQFEEKYDSESQVIEASIVGFIEKLLEESLIVVTPSNEQDPSDSFASCESVSNKTAYVIPVLEKYSDLEELLLLDPVHEVDEMGWPNAKT